MTFVDSDPCPSLAVALGWRMRAERNYARAKDRAIAIENQLTFYRPWFHKFFALFLSISVDELLLVPH